MLVAVAAGDVADDAGEVHRVASMSLVVGCRQPVVGGIASVVVVVGLGWRSF